MAKRIKKLKFKNNLFSLKKLLISFTVFLLLFITFGIGLKSGAERDELYKITKYFKDKIFTSKNKVSDLEISKKFENKIEYKKNQYDQLTFYHDKIQIERPLIDKKTLIIFTFGQSNSANHGGEKFFPKNENIINYWNKNYYLASDPLLGATGVAGSVWTNLGTKIVDNNLAEKVIIMAAGVSGTSIKKWANYGSLNEMLIERLKEAKKQKLDINYFLWHQGESDYILSPVIYSKKLSEVIKLTKKFYPKSDFFVSQASKCGVYPSNESLLNTQKEITKLNGVYLGPNTDLIEVEDRYDGCHLSGRGLEKHADAWFRIVKNHIKK